MGTFSKPGLEISGLDCDLWYSLVYNDKPIRLSGLESPCRRNYMHIYADRNVRHFEGVTKIKGFMEI